jgi:hypothetical protein
MNDYERKLTEDVQDDMPLWISSYRLLGVRHFVQATIVTVGLTMTLYPISMLYFHVSDWEKWPKIGLIVAFTILFTVLLRFSTKIPTHDLLNYSSG